VGGTKVALALGDPSGGLRARRRRPTEPSGDPERDIARIAADARALLAEAGVAPGELAGIGLSAPGPIDPATRRIQGPPNLPGWLDVPAPDLLAEALGRPVHLENDANAAALAEWRFGAGRGARDLAYVTLSSGVGAGLVLGGRLHRGAGWNAGEIGHVPVEWEGARCACGLRGCLEAYVGGLAWTRRLRGLATAAGRVAQLAGGPERVLPEHVVAAAREGDAFALQELDRWNGYVARGLVSLAGTVAPEVIVLGTIATAAGEELCLEPVRLAVRAHLWPGLAREVRIVAAALGDRLPDYAGLCVALEGLEAASSLRT
jgi:glucokinase